MTSFCFTKNECCTSDPSTNSAFAIGSCYGSCICCDDCCKRWDCDLKCGCKNKGNEGGGDGLGLLIIFIIILVLIGIFFALRGKHISRIFIISFLFLIEIEMGIIAIISGEDFF